MFVSYPAQKQNERWNERSHNSTSLSGVIMCNKTAMLITAHSH